MAITAYFDTNVFNHIHKGYDVTAQDMETLSSAVKAGKVSIVLSIHVLEELLSTLQSLPDLAKALVQLFLDLADWDRVAKPAHLLLSDDISRHASGEVLNNPFVEDGALGIIQGNLRALLNPGPQGISELLADASEAQNQKIEFMVRMEKAKEKILPHVEQLQGWRPSFDDYCESLSEKFAEGLAERQGTLDACRKKGIKNMLDIRSVRMCVGTHLSYAYAQTFEGRIPKVGDSRDIQHAVVATAADVFVTQDSKLEKLLDRVPLGEFKVSSLQGFLKLVG